MMGTRRLLHAVLLLGAGAASAAAQSNSLFHRSRAAAAQASAGSAAAPAASAAESAAPAPAQPPVRPAVFLPIARPSLASASSAGLPPFNEPLLYVSPIAVQLPEPRRLGVHDLVTIIVREDKKSTTDADLKSDKSWEINTELAKWFRLDVHDRLVPQNFPRGAPGVDFTADSQYEGKGKVNRQDTLILRITAQVLDVKPNGTLTLEARKSIETDEDVQTMTLTGVCRSEDVTAENTVLSTQLADAHIGIEHSGPARDAARRGWLMRAFDFLRPF